MRREQCLLWYGRGIIVENRFRGVVFCGFFPICAVLFASEYDADGMYNCIRTRADMPVLPLLCVLLYAAAAAAAPCCDACWVGRRARHVLLMRSRDQWTGLPAATAHDDQLSVVWKDLGGENGAIHPGGL